MNIVFKQLSPFTRSRLFSFTQRLSKKSCSLVLKYRHEDALFLVDGERELTSPQYHQIANEYLGVVAKGHRVFVTQPYIRFGPDKKTNTNPDLQLAECVALVETLSYWSVIDKMRVPLASFIRKELFGTGKMEEIKARIRDAKNVTAVFIS